MLNLEELKNLPKPMMLATALVIISVGFSFSWKLGNSEGFEYQGVLGKISIDTGEGEAIPFERLVNQTQASLHLLEKTRRRQKATVTKLGEQIKNYDLLLGRLTNNGNGLSVNKNKNTEYKTWKKLQRKTQQLYSELGNDEEITRDLKKQIRRYEVLSKQVQ